MGEESVAGGGDGAEKRNPPAGGLFSGGRCQKTSFALALGQILARQKAVLYLNLEEYAGFEQLFSCTYEKNLSDLLYYIRQDSSNLIFRINSMVQSFQNMDDLPPALSPADLMAASWEEWSNFLIH